MIQYNGLILNENIIDLTKTMNLYHVNWFRRRKCLIIVWKKYDIPPNICYIICMYCVNMFINLFNQIAIIYSPEFSTYSIRYCQTAFWPKIMGFLTPPVSCLSRELLPWRLGITTRVLLAKEIKQVSISRCQFK